MSIKVSICVPVHNRADMVRRLLTGFQNTEAATLEQVFVDDYSDEETRKVLLTHVGRNKNAQYLRNESQQLFTRSQNRAIRCASPDTDYYLCVNTDCLVKQGWVQLLVEEMINHPMAAIIGYHDGKPGNEGGLQQAYYPSRSGFPDYVTGHCFMVPRWAFLNVGLLCETDLQQAHIGSERIWCWKACGSVPYGEGYEMYYVNSNLVEHDEGGASWHRDLNWLHTFDYTKLWDGRDQL
jgi:GT2 family glycosyltransferase